MLRRFQHTVRGAAGIFRLVKPGWLGLVLVAVAAVFWLAAGGSVARAAEPPTKTSLTVQPLAQIELGTTATVSARLTTSSGVPIAGEAVGLAVDEVQRFRAVTDQNGNASFTVPGDLVAGTHPLAVVFEGTGTLAASSARLDMVIVPATIEIQTVPALPGIEFSLDGHPFASDSDGVARYTVTRAGLYRLVFVSDSTSAPNTRFSFSRWGDGVFVPERQVSVPSNTRFRFGFNVSYLTNLTFVDAANQPVAPGRITSLTIRSPHRQVYTFDRVQPEWLPATTVIQDGKGLKTTAINYSVDEVLVDGVPVVDPGQQHFDLAVPSAPRISLKLYPVHLRGHDALYGFPLGTGAYLQHPDGFVEYQPFDSAHVATFRALPLATFRTGVIGGPGMARSEIFDLTPGQTVSLSVISYFDMATALAGFGFLALIVFVSVPSSYRRWIRRLHSAPVDVVQPNWRRPYGIRFGYLSLGGLLALGFILTLEQAPGIGEPSIGASAATALFPRTVKSTAVASTTGTNSQPAQPEPAAPLSAQAEVSPIFYTVWRRNGGYVTLGAARSAAFGVVDANSGEQLNVQYFGRARLEYHPEFQGTPYQVQLGRLGLEEAQRRGLAGTEPFQPLAESSVLTTPDCEYFPKTGHQLCGRFRDYWHSHGLKLGDTNATSTRESLALLGYPISEEFTDPDTGRTIQYFERARLEYNPEQAGTPDEVVAGNLTVESP
jgi:hypothetical protein